METSVAEQERAITSKKMDSSLSSLRTVQLRTDAVANTFLARGGYNRIYVNKAKVVCERPSSTFSDLSAESRDLSTSSDLTDTSQEKNEVLQFVMRVPDAPYNLEDQTVNDVSRFERLWREINPDLPVKAQAGYRMTLFPGDTPDLLPRTVYIYVTQFEKKYLIIADYHNLKEERQQFNLTPYLSKKMYTSIMTQYHELRKLRQKKEELKQSYQQLKKAFDLGLVESNRSQLLESKNKAQQSISKVQEKMRRFLALPLEIEDQIFNVLKLKKECCFVPYLGRTVASDEEMLLLVVDTYKRTNRILLDAPSVGNVLQYNDRTYAVDIEAALCRNKSRVSFSIWTHTGDSYFDYWAESRKKRPKTTAMIENLIYLESQLSEPQIDPIYRDVDILSRLDHFRENGLPITIETLVFLAELKKIDSTKELNFKQLKMIELIRLFSALPERERPTELNTLQRWIDYHGLNIFTIVRSAIDFDEEVDDSGIYLDDAEYTSSVPCFQGP